MKRLSIFILSLLMCFAFVSCSTPIYPALPNANIEGQPMKGVEIYCWQEEDEWKCGGTLGTNRLKFDEEIRSLQVVTIPQMKRILEQKGLTSCFVVTIIDISGDEVVYLNSEEYHEESARLMLLLGAEE